MRHGIKGWAAALSLPILGLGIGAVGVATAVAGRYAGVKRVDNVVSIWAAAAACLGGLATLAMAAIFVFAARSAPRRAWLAALPAAAVGALLWQAVSKPPKEALALGLFLLFASPFLVVSGIVAAILLGVNWLDRRVTRAR